MIPLQVYQSCGLPAMCRVQRAEERKETEPDKKRRKVLTKYLHKLFKIMKIQNKPRINKTEIDSESKTKHFGKR